MKFKFQSPETKFYSNTATSVHLYNVYSGFCAAMAEFSSCHRDQNAPKAKSYLRVGALTKNVCQTLLISMLEYVFNSPLKDACLTLSD